MASPAGWRRNKKLERRNSNLEYYWNDPGDEAGTYISVTEIPNKNGKYNISASIDGMSLSRQNFENPYKNKEEARKDAVAWMKANNPNSPAFR